MTRIFERLVAGPGTHALVVGVGAYPFAQNPEDEVEELRGVPQNESFATSAAMFADWLIRNANKINPRLATIDLLLCAVATGVPGGHISSYVWKGRVRAPDDAKDPRPDAQVDPPTSHALKEAGAGWLNSLKDDRGSHALFYGCGHGTNLPGKYMLLLQDLNASPGDPWSAHFDVSHHARAFNQIPEIDQATFFLDACAERLNTLYRDPPGNGVRLANHFADRAGGRKVFALTAAEAPSLTFEGVIPGSHGLKAGRFTQCLLQALDGAATRLLNGIGQWGVHTEALKRTTAQLCRLRNDWRDKPPLRPTVIEDPIDGWSIVTPEAPILVPFCVDVLPECDTPDWALSVFNHEVPQSGVCLHSRPSGAAARWVVQVPVATQRYALVAQRLAPQMDCVLPVLPTQALFDLRVP